MNYIFLLKTIYRDSIIRNVIYWLLFYFLLVFIASFFQDTKEAFELVTLFILPIIIPVHLNFYLLNRYFLKQKYWQYFILVFVLIIVFGFIAQFLMDITINTEDTYFGAILDPFIFIIVTSGLKGYKEYLQNKYLIQEARANQAETKLKLSEVESKQTKAELDLLKAQVNPHFLFNTLNNIYSLAMDKSTNTAKAVMSLSKLMRYQLESSKYPMVALIKEVGFIKEYIELEKLRIKNKCKIDFTVDGILDNHGVPSLLLLPLVENCFKHGIGVKRENNIILIHLRIEQNILYFETRNNISENSSYYPDDKIEKTGIDNMKRRLELLYNNKYDFVIEKNNGVYYTRLKIEL